MSDDIGAQVWAGIGPLITALVPAVGTFAVAVLVLGTAWVIRFWRSGK